MVSRSCPVAGTSLARLHWSGKSWAAATHSSSPLRLVLGFRNRCRHGRNRRARLSPSLGAFEPRRRHRGLCAPDSTLSRRHSSSSSRHHHHLFRLQLGHRGAQARTQLEPARVAAVASSRRCVGSTTFGASCCSCQLDRARRRRPCGSSRCGGKPVRKRAGGSGAEDGSRCGCGGTDGRSQRNACGRVGAFRRVIRGRWCGRCVGRDCLVGEKKRFHACT